MYFSARQSPVTVRLHALTSLEHFGPDSAPVGLPFPHPRRRLQIIDPSPGLSPRRKSAQVLEQFKIDK